MGLFRWASLRDVSRQTAEQPFSFIVSVASLQLFCLICAQDESGYEHFKNLPGRTKRPETSWYEDSKLGLFIHWGLYSVPGWATTAQGVIDFFDPAADWRKWFTNNAYSEWYLHTLRIPGSPTAKHHEEIYGEDYDYYKFAKEFNAGVSTKWKPDEWAELFARSGFRYVVLTTKHHDGFTLFPSDLPNPHIPAGTPPVAVDIVGRLTDAVRKIPGMDMGLYYSGGYDWSFEPAMDKTHLWPAAPRSDEYAKQADGHLKELISRYKPAVLWNDIGYPKSPPADLDGIFGMYYQTVPHGIVNDRFFPLPRSAGSSGAASFLRKIGDIICPEYQSFPKPLGRKWETCRGISHSFGYNGNETEKDQITYHGLIYSLLDISAKNGNLLLGIGPRADGSIPLLQRRRLRVLGQWLAINGAGVYGTRPWWDGEADGTIEGPDGVRDVKAVTKSASGGGYYVFLGVLGDALEGKASIRGFSKLGKLLKGNPGAKVEVLVAGGNGSAHPWNVEPTTVNVPFEVSGDEKTVSITLPKNVPDRLRIEVPVAKDGESTGKDSDESAEQYEKKILAYTLRAGPFARETAKM
ncbi:family 29 glycoside hydrolase [Hyaloraphidium curvatum]|nr:family 29 glycoside hydrolase [Hyaloraphidium curvatum]